MLNRWTGAAALAVALTLTAAAAEPESYGAGVSLAETTPLARILDRPADFEGQTVRVEGQVTAVCQHMGCWMALAPQGAADARTLLLKVDDGVIVFPVTAKGRRAVAQGVVQKVGGDAESLSAADEHARHSGAAAAPATWQIKATGALLYE